MKAQPVHGVDHLGNVGLSPVDVDRLPNQMDGGEININ